MRIRRYYLFFTLCLFVLATPVHAEPVGRFTAVEGRVVRIASDGATLAVKLDDPVRVGDTVGTQSNGKAEITFADGTIIRLAADTRTKISQYRVREKQSQGTLSLLGGKVQSLVKKGLGLFGRTRRNRFEVHTPTAVAGVRGTDFFTYYQEDVSGVIFKEGRGYCYSLQQPDHILEISAGQAMQLKDPFGPPEIRRVSKQELEQHLKETTPGKAPGKRGKAPTAGQSRKKGPGEKPARGSRPDRSHPGQKGGPEKEVPGSKPGSEPGSEPGRAFESEPPGKMGEAEKDPMGEPIPDRSGFQREGQFDRQTGEQLAGKPEGAVISGKMEGSEPLAGVMEADPPVNELELADDPRQNQAMGEGAGPEQEQGRLTDNKPPPVSESIPDIVAENLPARFHNPHLDAMARYLLAESPELFQLAHTGVMAGNPAEGVQVAVDEARSEKSREAGGFADANGQPMGAIQADETYQKAMQVHSEVSGGLVYQERKGRYAGPISDDWQMDWDSWTEAGTWHHALEKSCFSEGRITGKGYLSWAELSRSLTGVGGGEVTGSFDPNQQTYETAEIWALVDTASFLRLAQEEVGRQRLSELNIPCVEIGKTDLAGSSENLSVSMNDVTFFAYSTGDAPEIWATESVGGTYQAEPVPEDTVTLSGEGIEAQFKVTHWESNRWGAGIEGAGRLERSDRREPSDIEFKGTGAGEYGEGRFSGTASGLAE